MDHNGPAWIEADERSEAAWRAYRALPSVDTARAYLACEAELSATGNETGDITVIDPTLEREAIAMSQGYAIGDYQLVAWGEIAGRAWQLRLSR